MRGGGGCGGRGVQAAELKFNPQRVHDVLKDEESLASESKNMQPSCGACHDCTQVYHVPAVVKPHKIEVGAGGCGRVRAGAGGWVGVRVGG